MRPLLTLCCCPLSLPWSCFPSLQVINPSLGSPEHVRFVAAAKQRAREALALAERAAKAAKARLSQATVLARAGVGGAAVDSATGAADATAAAELRSVALTSSVVAARADMLIAYGHATGGGGGGGAVALQQEVTSLGLALATLPLGARFAKMLLLGKQAGILGHTVCLVAALSEKDPFVRSAENDNTGGAGGGAGSGEGGDGDGEDDGGWYDEADGGEYDVADAVSAAAEQEARHQRKIAARAAMEDRRRLAKHGAPGHTHIRAVSLSLSLFISLSFTLVLAYSRRFSRRMWCLPSIEPRALALSVDCVESLINRPRAQAPRTRLPAWPPSGPSCMLSVPRPQPQPSPSSRAGRRPAPWPPRWRVRRAGGPSVRPLASTSPPW